METTQEKKAYIVVKDFAKFQHYKDKSRPVIWIKLYIQLLRSDKFFNLTETERWIYIGLLLLAALKNNKILYDLNFIRANICHYDFTNEQLEGVLQRLIQYKMIDSKLIASCQQDDSLEKSRVEESKGEQSISDLIDDNKQASKQEHIQITEVMDMFKKINPVISFGNKTFRQAIVDLVKAFGFEKVKRSAEYAISVQGKTYAPTITNPYQLKQKLADLMVYYKKSNQGKGREII